MPIIYLKWIDSCHTSGWTFTDNLTFDKEDMLFESIGFLLKETDYSVILIQSKSWSNTVSNHQVDSVMEIPKVAIIHQQLYEPTGKTRTLKPVSE